MRENDLRINYNQPHLWHMCDQNWIVSWMGYTRKVWVEENKFQVTIFFLHFFFIVVTTHKIYLSTINWVVKTVNDWVSGKFCFLASACDADSFIIYHFANIYRLQITNGIFYFYCPFAIIVVIPSISTIRMFLYFSKHLQIMFRILNIGTDNVLHLEQCCIWSIGYTFKIVPQTTRKWYWIPNRLLRCTLV